MTRCKHLNVDVIEEFAATSIHEIRGGRLACHYNDMNGEYTGRFSVKCHDCKKRFEYASYKAAPAWARRRFDVATHVYEEEE
jgi:phage FluMu protein Com